jgi:endonuclease YncB( thermonuclease family)
MIMRELIVVLAFIVASPGVANSQPVPDGDGDSLTVDGTKFKLDGVDAPELDQICLDEKGEVWACGIVARDRLRDFIGNRKSKCTDLGAAFPGKRRIGKCDVDGDDLSEWLVREGWALNFEPHASGRFIALENDARVNRRGIWKGCFATPQDFRRGIKGTLSGPSCSIVGDDKARERLFPDHPAMPPGCTLKGKFSKRARLTGHVCIYHVEGCGSWQRLKSPDRWFCSEEDAWAAGCRKALNCRKSAR